MSNTVRAIPEGYHSITPGLTCKDAARAMDFYKQIFGATEIMRMPGPDGRVMHGELRIGDSVIFVSDEFPGMSCAPTPGATNPVYIFGSVAESMGKRAVEKDAAWKSPKAGLSHSAWKSRKGGGGLPTFPTAPAATIDFLIF